MIKNLKIACPAMAGKIQNYATGVAPTWCPGCGNYLVLAALKLAFAKLDIPSHQIVIAHDIGCSGNMADFIKTYALHTLHGRVVPTAMGVKIANPKLTVCCFGGDGGVYGEGLNHLISAARANSPIKVFVSNNQLYSLTTGQTSPTTPQKAATKSTPFGNPNLPLDPVTLLKTINPAIFAKRIKKPSLQKLTRAFIRALQFDGFCLLDIHQFCLAFGKQLNS